MIPERPFFSPDRGDPQGSSLPVPATERLPFLPAESFPVEEITFSPTASFTEVYTTKVPPQNEGKASLLEPESSNTGLEAPPYHEPKVRTDTIKKLGDVFGEGNIGRSLWSMYYGELNMLPGEIASFLSIEGISARDISRTIDVCGIKMRTRSESHRLHLARMNEQEKQKRSEEAKARWRNLSLEEKETHAKQAKEVWAGLNNEQKQARIANLTGENDSESRIKRSQNIARSKRKAWEKLSEERYRYFQNLQPQVVQQYDKFDRQFPPGVLEDMILAGMSVKSIAIEAGTSKDYIYRRLQELGIDYLSREQLNWSIAAPPLSEAIPELLPYSSPKKKGRLILSVEEKISEPLERYLYRHYWKSRFTPGQVDMSSGDIARLLNLDEDTGFITVWRWLKICNIETRDISAAQKLFSEKTKDTRVKGARTLLKMSTVEDYYNDIFAANEENEDTATVSFEQIVRRYYDIYGGVIVNIKNALNNILETAGERNIYFFTAEVSAIIRQLDLPPISRSEKMKRIYENTGPDIKKERRANQMQGLRYEDKRDVIKQAYERKLLDELQIYSPQAVSLLRQKYLTAETDVPQLNEIKIVSHQKHLAQDYMSEQSLSVLEGKAIRYLAQRLQGENVYWAKTYRFTPEFENEFRNLYQTYLDNTGSEYRTIAALVDIYGTSRQNIISWIKTHIQKNP